MTNDGSSPVQGNYVVMRARTAPHVQFQCHIFSEQGDLMGLFHLRLENDPMKIISEIFIVLEGFVGLFSV